MPPKHRRLRRIEEPGHARYLTCSCYHNLELFSNDQIKDAFAERLAFVRRTMGFELYAWVIMPNHVHLLLRPSRSETVDRILRRLKAPFARRVIERWRTLNAAILPQITDSKGRPHFWQQGGGYDRNIVNDHAVRQKIDYIHANPVRRELANRPTDWPWSSAQWYESDQTMPVPIDPLTLGVT